MRIDPRHQTFFGISPRHLYRFLLLAAFLCQPSVYAQVGPGPRPPCGNEPVPPYPGLGDSASVKAWSRSEVGDDWRPPACTGWASPGFTTLVTISARFRYDSGADNLLRRIGAISELAGIRYWSSTSKRWQTLIVDAHALTGLQSSKHREDFRLDEIKEGIVLYFEQIDNRSGKAIYRMHVAEVSTDRIVFDIENVSTIRYFLVPLFRPGEIQSVYFFQQEAPGVWLYYSLTRTGSNANRLAAGHDASSINRAVAFFRYWAGIPTDSEPPAAR